MIVEVQCNACTDDYVLDIRMEAVGPLVISQDKTQFQEYMCRTCHRIVRVRINTTREPE